MILLWSVRFVVEFIKVGQTERDTYWIINTGQLLSLPMIMVGVYFLAQGIKEGRVKSDV
jgi:prolipoprotein diacylglyceryltransferase